MLFNSISFAIFLPIVFLAYWFLCKGDRKKQNLLLLLSSYYFYSSWDWRFLFLLLFSTGLDFFTAIKIKEASARSLKRFWLWLSVSINLGFLGTFKYFDFFSNSFAELLAGFGLQVNPVTINLILPVGISFYTFHGLSYIIDVYKDKIEAEKNFVEYAVFVSYFPLLVAGPIERATHLLPQIKNDRSFNYNKAIIGLRQILWGLFKKVVIADQCAMIANEIFNHSESYSGLTLLAGAIFFSFQIYGDFSGYSDIALGTSRLFGIELLQNFSFPYFSRDIAEFWRRWHISLSSWFKDYLYIPLGGSKAGNWVKVRNTFIIFLVSGFWHGANWTFIAWGFLNALYITPLVVLQRNRQNLEIVAKGKWLPSFREFGSIILTFGLTVFAWIFFRANNLHHAFQFISDLFSGLSDKKALVTAWQIILDNSPYLMATLAFFLLMEWIGRESRFAIESLPDKWTAGLRLLFYYVLTLAIIFFAGKEEQFIYFQF
jgi:D-alanyl-lipoteichoic acid acyltransferase DltB (MBOAT superfamily)